MRRVLQDGDEPTVEVAHSYGRIVTAKAAAWHHVPATCLVCAEDAGTRLQRGFTGSAGRIVEIDAGHHPLPFQPSRSATCCWACETPAPHTRPALPICGCIP